MGRPGITREQVFETADAIAREGVTPTVMAVRKRLGGGSPNNITKWLSEWKTQNETTRIEALPPFPEPVEAAMRQVWGTAWKGAREQLESEREALSTARKEIERERSEMLTEIARLDGEIEAARTQTRDTDKALDDERRTHDETRAELREIRALAEERSRRIEEQNAELHEVRNQASDAQADARRMEADIAHLIRDLDGARRRADQETDAKAKLASNLNQAYRKIDGLQRNIQLATETEAQLRDQLQIARGELNKRREAHNSLTAERDRALTDNKRLSADLLRAKQQLQEEKKILDIGGKKIQRLEAAIGEERTSRNAAEKTSADLRVEAATLTERAAHADELRKLIDELRRPERTTEKKPRTYTAHGRL